ncbi:hypothetical protein OWV82_010378 [Melia azedarach]|uniref:Uncharacterized protein n=1 Tax=Melia azedarach TaxID=155640 RepID=A0ACC1Y4X4_MELAZ|nr:hypothetical protein OWV82_010378 [Melia azedarach]
MILILRPSVWWIVETEFNERSGFGSVLKERELEKWTHTAELKLKLIVAKQEQKNGGHFHTVAETGHGTEVHVLSFSDLRLEDLVKYFPSFPERAETSSKRRARSKEQEARSNCSTTAYN